MQLSRKPRSVRRILVGAAFVGTLAVGVALGTLFTSSQAVAQQDMVLNAPTVMLHWVKSASTADYERVMDQLRTALDTSGNEETDRQNQAAGWKVYRATDDLTGRGAMYVHIIDPVLQGADYSAMNIIAEVVPDPAEQQTLYETYAGSIQEDGATIWRTSLTAIAGF